MLPHDAVLYAMLRTVLTPLWHFYLSPLYIHFIIAHFQCGRIPAVIYRDGRVPSMASGIFVQAKSKHTRTHDKTQCRKITLDKRAPSDCPTS